MNLAQRLYEGVELGDKGLTALITYMRTDSTRIADEARQAAKEYITAAYGKEYLPKRARIYKAKESAQDAHEAIRPVDVTLTPDLVRPHLAAGSVQSVPAHLGRALWPHRWPGRAFTIRP